ncbi:hypothetical protein [Helicobacter sp. T3_23-1056]
MQNLISKRHSLTELEHLELKELIREKKLIKLTKKTAKFSNDTKIVNLLNDKNNTRKKIFKKRKSAIKNRDIITTLQKVKNTSTAKSLLKNDNIALNEVLKLNNKRDCEIIETFFKRYNKDELNAKIFDKVFSLAKKHEVKVSFIAKKKVAANYILHTNIIRIFFNNKSKKFKTQLLLHELIHSVSMSALNDLKELDFALKHYPKFFINTQFMPLKNIEKMYESLPQDLKEQKGDDYYGFTNFEEFLAELVKPKFRKKLQKLGILESVLENFFAFLDKCDK